MHSFGEFLNDEQQLVSVLLPVHNGFPYVPEAIESIVNQTERRWKLIVVNDGSKDETREYLDTLTDPRIIVLHQENKGLAYSLNRALELSDTKYIARMDCDDISDPDRFKRQVDFLEANPEIGLLGTQIRRVGSRRSDKGSDLPTSHDAIFDALMNGHHAICHPTIMCRKSVFDQVGTYTEGLGEEWDLFLRFGECSKLANLPEVLFGYRYHASSINGSRMDELRRRIRFTCECSRRRVAGIEQQSYEDFIENEDNETSYFSRVTQRIEDYSRANYHSAIADILGEHPIRGYARLGFAAASAPHITFERLKRKFSKTSKATS